MNNLFFASIKYAFMRKLPAIKNVGKAVALCAFTIGFVAMVSFTIHNLWTPHGVHTLVEKEPISGKHCWLVFEQNGTQRRVMSYDPESVPLGAQKNIESSWFKRGINRMM
jgi:hypothetical protein